MAAARAEPPPPEPPADMTRIPAGPFTMGADSGGEQDEHPAHVVTLGAYWLDKTEVTNAAYRECMTAKACRPYKAGPWATYGADRAFRGDQQPVVGVSWEDAKTFCEWKGKRLPTEAEFEKAARGPGPGGGAEDRTFPWGNDKPDGKKHGVWGRQVTENVGSYPEGAGPYGNLDMAGNVWEWMADYYDPYAYRRDTADRGVPGSCEQIRATQDTLRREGMQGFTGTNPIPEGCDRVLRGGAFNYHTRGLRVTNRVHHPGTWRLVMAGFRCAQTEPGAESPSTEETSEKRDAE
ncbi:MAG: formylglycine-generating enzyme family protein [Polyangiaceae bacterium]